MTPRSKAEKGAVIEDPRKLEATQSALHNRRGVLTALVGGMAAAAGGLFFSGKEEPASAIVESSSTDAGAGEAKVHDATPKRLVSLSPGVTETIIALGRGELLSCVSDYCELPAGLPRPRVGTALTPNFEKIAACQPDLILASEVAGDTLAPLEKFAPTISLPWLTLDEWFNSISVLGAKIGSASEAKVLTDALREALRPKVTPRSPRVLLTLDYGATGSSETWFIRKNSIHGAALEAAGAENAITREVTEQPKLSPEALLAADPDAIIVLRPAGADPAAEAQSLAHFQRWSPLAAVRTERIKVLSLPGVLTIGPAVVDLVGELEKCLEELFSEMAKGNANRKSEGQ